MRAVHSIVSVNPEGGSHISAPSGFSALMASDAKNEEGVEMGSRFQTTLWSMEN